MPCNTKYCTITFFIATLALFTISCEKEQPNCSSNCVTIAISGSAYIKTTGAALKNVPVEINWYRNAYCIGCTSYKVASGKTDDNGNFSFATTIDTTFFQNYLLSVKTPADTNYIIAPGVRQGDCYEMRFWNFSPNSFQNMKFEFYPKTNLTIRLHRTLGDNFRYFTVETNFTPDFGSGYGILYGPQYPKDTIFQLVTSPDVYTRIVWRKKDSGVQISEQRDSLICTNNGNNVFDINY